jgi:hypothetical protein
MMHRFATAMVSKSSCIPEIRKLFNRPNNSLRMILYRYGAGQKVVVQSSAAVLLNIRHCFAIDFSIYFEIIIVGRGSGRGFVWNRVG